jgi:hypothetical protein
MSVQDTGIITDSVSGLVAGLPLDGDYIQDNPSVVRNPDDNEYEWVSGLDGNAFRGDEDGDFLRLESDDFPQLSTSGTLEVWIYPQDDDNDPETQDNYWTGILHKGERPEIHEDGWFYVDEAWSLQFKGKRMPTLFVVFPEKDSDGKLTSVNIDSNMTVELDTWTHLAASWSYSSEESSITMSFYINGELVNTLTTDAAGPVRTTDGDIIVGSQLPEKYNDKYGHMTFTGLIDNVSIYNVERSAEQIKEDYEKLASAADSWN